MVRTYKDIYEDYCNWMVEKTGDDSFSYKKLIESEGDSKVVDSTLYESILKLCYDRDNGLYYFCKFIVGDLRELGYPKPFRFNSLLRKWDKIVKRKKHICVQCSRGHGKTVFFSQILQIYDMFLHPYKKILLESASQEQSNLIINDIRSIIESNEWLITKKNDDKWRTDMLGYNGGFILGKGFGSEVRGLHLDRIIIDDILRSDNKLSDTEIEDFIDMVLEPMLLNRKGQMILVGTPKNENDIFQTISRRIKEGSSWYMAKFPAIVDYDNQLLQCPDRFTWKEIMDKRLLMGPLKFGREYQLNIFSRDTSLFPSRILDPAKDMGRDKSLILKHDFRSPNWTFVAGVDVARSGSVSADYTVMVVLAFDTVNNTKQIVHMWREKGLKISEQAQRIAEIAKRFDNCYVLVEQNNMGQEMIDRLADDWNVNVDSFLTGKNKFEELIRFLVVSFEHEQIVIPRADDWSRQQMDILEEELSKFCELKTPNGNYKYEGVGAHDDIVMALCLANKATQTAGIPFALTDWQRSDNDLYGGLTDNWNAKGETDLVKKIRMGLIK